MHFIHAIPGLIMLLWSGFLGGKVYAGHIEHKRRMAALEWVKNAEMTILPLSGTVDSELQFVRGYLKAMEHIIHGVKIPKGEE